MRILASLSGILLAGAALTAASPTLDNRSSPGNQVPAPPKPEAIKLTRLPLPPAIPRSTPGACNATINPRHTGCMPITNGRSFMNGGFLPDGKHVIALVHFIGAPAAPEPGSSYNGSQIILVKTDDSVFENKEKWKCITCGVPGVPNTVSVEWTEHLDYPQAFDDGKRILAGPYIIDCGKYNLASKQCTPERTNIYPIRWETTVDGSGPGGAIRELRLHPDNVHLGFSSFTQTGGKLGQLAYFGRLKFNKNPTKGLPLAPRYELHDVNLLLNPTAPAPIETSGNQLLINPNAISVGELRGFSGPGDEIVYVGYPTESSNLDIYAVGLTNGKVRRITSHPEYIDPIDGTRDGKWWAIMDTRGTDRQMFLSGMRHVPPITDLVTTSVTSATRNNGQRRFFVPYVLDNYGDRGEYYGQKVNGPGFGELGSGSLNDPQWNGQADPKWSLDATKLVYWEAQTVTPACGGENPLPCYPSKEAGGRDVRMVMATFPSRKPAKYRAVRPVADRIPWATPYVPGNAFPERPFPKAGSYTLKGKFNGSASIEIQTAPGSTSIEGVSVVYHDFSDDGKIFLTGYENATTSSDSLTFNRIEWFSDLTQRGPGDIINTKVTSDDGFHLRIDVLANRFDANGTITTTIGGKEYLQPLNGA